MQQTKTVLLAHVAIELFLNYKQHKVIISGEYFFPFASFVTSIIVTDKFGEKCYLIFLKYKEIKRINQKMPDLIN